MGLLDRLFSDRDQGQQAAVREARAKAQRILDWASSPYHEEFLMELQKMTEEPIPTDARMGATVVRINTLREIRSYILDLVRKAERVLTDAAEGD